MRLTLFNNLWFNVAVVVAAGIIQGLAAGQGRSYGDWLVTAVFAMYAIYCIQNFIACREVHCAITAPGFAIAAVLMALRLHDSARYGTTLPWDIFVGAAALGYCIEWIYHARTGSVFLGGSPKSS